jgi:two-component system response regulator AtoC
MDNQILVVDDEQDFLDTIRRGLIISGFSNVHLENCPQAALALFQQGRSFDVALLDITMPRMDGITLLEEIKAICPATECIMVTAQDETSLAVDSIKKGAYDYLVKPISREDLLLAVNRALEHLRFLRLLDVKSYSGLKQLKNPEAFASIVTESTRVLRVLREAELHAASNVPVLITGESGTGKELLAQAIHRASSRSEARFYPINMAAITPSLFDAEFFGHTRGAFTGAQSDRTGYLATADKGSLFLDEIGSLVQMLQGKLLRVLQEGEHIPVGTDTPKKTDLRFIAATNANIENLVARGRFRKDLYYRLKGACLQLPPLRERKGDIPLLAAHFLGETGEKHPKQEFSAEAMAVLEGYDYPGNLRELKSIVSSALNLAQGGQIRPEHFPPELKPRRLSACEKEKGPILSLAAIEKQHILEAYSRLGRNKSRTADVMGIGLNTLRRKLKSWQVG